MATVTQRPKPDFELDLRQDIRTGLKMLQKKLALEGYGLQPVRKYFAMTSALAAEGLHRLRKNSGRRARL
jgi:hypothetical protein